MPGAATDAVHAGERPDPEDGAVNLRIVQSTTYRFPQRADGSAATHIYSRYDNPTVQAVEEKAAALEGADHALAFASGMGAISAVCLAWLRPGDRIAVQEGVYGGTTALFADLLAPWGVKVETFALAPGGGAGRIRKGTKVVWVESLTNPLLRVADIPAWAEAAHKVGARVVVDATFATPVLQRPLALGADLVMHSGSKYMNGHSDVTCGLLAGRNEDRDALWKARRNLGATLDPLAGYLLGRGMKTLPLRMERHCVNATAVAAAVAEHPVVRTAHYPGLRDHPDHATASRLLPAGYGGMVTLDLGSREAAQAFRRAVRLVTPAASLGGVDSLCSLPLETSHAYASAQERRDQGVTDGLVRISCGLEDTDDLVADVLEALDSARR